MNIRVPTYQDYEQHDGLHYHQLWREVGGSWLCPSCRRTKFQIMKWTKRFPTSPNSFMGWVATLHKHHDHSVNDIPFGQSRFPQTIICSQCNSADGSVKRKLSLPSNFSFSPQEIGLFVKATPHDKHVINYDIAKSIYSELIFENMFWKS